MPNDILITTYKGNTNDTIFSSIAFTGSTGGGTCFLEPLNAGFTGIRFQAGATTLLLLSTAGTTLFSVNNVSGLARLEIGGIATASGAVIFSDNNGVTFGSFTGSVTNSSVIFKGPVGCSFLSIGTAANINTLSTSKWVYNEGHTGGATWASTIPLGYTFAAGTTIYLRHAGTTISYMRGKVGNSWVYDASPSQSALFITKATGQTRGKNDFSQYNPDNPHINGLNLPLGGAVPWSYGRTSARRVWDMPGTSYSNPWTKGGYCGGAWNGGATYAKCFVHGTDAEANGPNCTHPVGCIAFVMSRYIGWGHLKAIRIDGHMSVPGISGGSTAVNGPGGLAGFTSPSTSPFPSGQGWTSDGGAAVISGYTPSPANGWRAECLPAAIMGGIAQCAGAACSGYSSGHDVCKGEHHIQSDLQLGQIALMWNGIDDLLPGCNYGDIELAGFLVNQMQPPATTGLPRNLVVAATNGLQHMNIGNSLWRILTAPTCGSYLSIMLAVRVE